MKIIAPCLGLCVVIIAICQISCRLQQLPPAQPQPSIPTPQPPFEIPGRDLSDIAHRLGHTGDVPLASRTAPRTYGLGDHESFTVMDLNSTGVFTITAELRAIGQHIYLWVQDDLTTLASDIARAVEVFDANVYPTNHHYFGSEPKPGVDGDARVHVLCIALPGASGYFYSANEYSRSVNPYSNEREIFYVNIQNRAPGSDTFNATLAHEFQHLIHWAQDADEDAWVNEGCSELAMQLNGLPTSGYEREFARQPDTQLNAWGTGAGTELPHYGASSLFMRYFAHRFGPDAIRHLVAQPENGIAGFNTVLSELGTGLIFEDVFADWVVANWLNDATISDGIYGYGAPLGVTLEPSVTVLNYPAEGEGVVHQYAADYIVLRSITSPLTIEFQGQTTAKLVPTDAPSGQYLWWSNRGDANDSTLTRAFDLTSLTTATLEFSMWYDIEAGWDYAYVEVSTDGGEQWNVLTGTHTTTWDPVGNSFGPGYTGTSGCDPNVWNEPASAMWVQERVDLTPYTGKVVLVRFEYITDDQVTGHGFCLDDIRIPELGYDDDVEHGDSGWIGQGFRRTDNAVPQRYLVQVIVPGSEVPVQRVWAENGCAHLALDGPESGVQEAVLVISAIAPGTVLPTIYRYSVSKR